MPCIVSGWCAAVQIRHDVRRHLSSRFGSCCIHSEADDVATVAACLSAKAANPGIRIFAQVAQSSSRFVAPSLFLARGCVALGLRGTSYALCWNSVLEQGPHAGPTRVAGRLRPVCVHAQICRCHRRCVGRNMLLHAWASWQQVCRFYFLVAFQERAVLCLGSVRFCATSCRTRVGMKPQSEWQSAFFHFWLCAACVVCQDGFLTCGSADPSSVLTQKRAAVSKQSGWSMSY